MAALGDLKDLDNPQLPDPNPGDGGKSSSGTKTGPIRGARLEYDIPALGGRLLLKEPFGNWFGLKPVYPDYGSFKTGDNANKQFTKRAGFRFKSYTILLKPGTKIKCPKARAADQRKRNADTGTEDVQIGNISIGVSANVNVREFIEWLKSSGKKSSINGVVSPTLRKYQWGGVLHRAADTESKTPPGAPGAPAAPPAGPNLNKPPAA